MLKRIDTHFENKSQLFLIHCDFNYLRSMIKNIIFTWVKIFLGIIAISYLVSLYYKEFEPKQIWLIAGGSLLVAVAIELYRSKSTNRAKDIN